MPKKMLKVYSSCMRARVKNLWWIWRNVWSSCSFWRRRIFRL